MRPTLPLIAIALLGCSGDRGRANDSARSEGSSDEPTTVIPRPALRPSTFVRPPADTRAQLLRELQAQLETGRAALAANEFERAATELERAAAIDPSSVPTLVQLGNAYFELERYAEAQRVRETALHYTEGLPARAPQLFRLGNAVELGGQLGWASELYQRSLELAEAPEVREALVRLSHGAEVISHERCEWLQHGSPPPRLCQAYVQQLEGVGPFTCAYEPPDSAALELEGGRRISVFSYLEGEREQLVANAIVAGQWFSAPLAWIAHPKAGHADENLASLELRAEDLSVGGLPEVVIEWEVEGRALELEAQTEHTWATRDYAVLTVNGHGARWLLGLRTQSSHARGPIGAAPGDGTTRASVALEYDTTTGQLEVLRTQHEPSARLGKFALGTYPLLCPYEIGAS